MQLDHVSYATSHNQLADTVQRLGSRLSTTFQDGGIHPRFGTRNFTAPLLNGKYIEIVCPVDHPATEQTPWGKAVTKKANEGGGWLTWVFSTEDMAQVEQKFDRPAVDGHRRRPNGSELKWKQIGVREIEENPNLPFFIEWLSNEHPSQDGKPEAEISSITIVDALELNDSYFKPDILSALGRIELIWKAPNVESDQLGIDSVKFFVNGEIIEID